MECRGLVSTLFLLALLPAPATAWEPQVYEGFAKQVCAEFKCGCEDEILAAVMLPVQKFKDQVEHHCYRPADFDVDGVAGVWKAPSVDECPVLDKAESWLDSAMEKKACSRWADIGVSLSYFLDSKNFFQNVVSANKSCQKEFESQFTDYFLYGRSGWRACSCGVCTDSDELVDWKQEFIQMIKPLVNAKVMEAPSVWILSNELDLEAAKALAEGLKDKDVLVSVTAPNDFEKIKDMPFIVILGGQNARETKEVTDAILIDSEKDKIEKAVFKGELFVKKNVWFNRQTVMVIAGREKENTLKRAESAAADVADVANSMVDSDKPECEKSRDCGSSYWGPWVCSSFQKATRVRYKNVCVRGECKLKTDMPVKMNCGQNELCKTFSGCVNRLDLAENEGVTRPSFISWLSSDRVTQIIGRNKTHSIYIKTNGTYVNESFDCQVQESSGWEDYDVFESAGIKELRISTTSDEPGKKLLTYKVRCGNSTGEEGFTTWYTGTHQMEVTYIPPPLTYSFTIEPEEVTLDGCFGTANVSARVENHAGQNISCSVTVGNQKKTVKVTQVGYTFDKAKRRWGVVFENTTYSVLSYYSGSDFANGSYNKTDVEGNTTWYNISAAVLAAYDGQPENITIIVPRYTNETAYENSTISYSWTIDPWIDTTFTVSSDQCRYDRLKVVANCTDVWGQTSIVQKELGLEIKKG